MKLKKKPAVIVAAQKAHKAATTATSKIVTAKAAKGSKTISVPTIESGTFDSKAMYSGKRVPKTAIRAAAVGKEIGALDQHGFLLLKGNKPGVIILEVKHDAKGDIYTRKHTGVDLYGSVSAINATAGESLEAEIVDAAGLFKQLKKLHTVMTLTQKSSGKKFKVALLNPFSDPYVAGVYVANEKVHIVNMEHPASFNQGAKDAHFVAPQNEEAKPFLAKLETLMK
jgi:hypothetical protein